MIELLDSLGREKAVFVGHDWGSPVVWSLASHHPDRCHGVANLCVPYIPDGFAPANIIPLVDRKVYPEAEFPAGQWDYQLFYEESFDKARGRLRGRLEATVKALFRAGNRGGRGPAGDHRGGAQDGRLVRRAGRRAGPAARRQRDHRGGLPRLRRGAEAQRLLRARTAGT